MRNLVRSPLTWMVAAELVVVTLLAGVAWQLFTAGTHPVAAATVSPRASVPGEAAPSVPDLAVPVAVPPSGPAPGLNVGAAFWRARLAGLDRDQELLGQLEWRLVSAAEAAVKRYLDTVVLPAVRRAERARRPAVR
jgi:hypothetical protein